MRIEVLLTEEELRREFVLCLKRSEIPEKFFYWFPTSLAAWLALCNSTKYRNYDRSIELIKTSVQEIVDHLSPDSLTWVSLGCGRGTKEPYILQSLKERGTQTYYQPVDTSLPLLELACQEGEAVGIDTVGFKADFRCREHLEWISNTSKDQPSVFSLFGNTVGSEEPFGILPLLRQVMTPDDYLLVDGELFSGNTTLKGYDNPDNLAFAMAPLREIGLTEQDGTLKFDLVVEGDGLYYVRKSYTFHRNFTLNIFGEAINFNAGDGFVMSRSYKYTKERFTQLLNETGFQIMELFSFGEEMFILALAHPY